MRVLRSRMKTTPLGYWRQWRTGGGVGVFNPPPKFRRPSKIVANSTRLWKLLKIAEFRMPTHQDVRKKGSKILKLPPVRNCFTFVMTNKLVVIINSLKVSKIKKIILYEMKFLVPNYSCLQNFWLEGYRPPDPRSLCPQLNLLNPPPLNKIPEYANDWRYCKKAVAYSQQRVVHWSTWWTKSWRFLAVKEQYVTKCYTESRKWRKSTASYRTY